MGLKEYDLKDTVAAVATFPSKSALGVIKVSGKQSIPVVSKIFIPAKKKNLKKQPNFTVHYGWIKDINNKKAKLSSDLVDEVLVTLMKAPNSYTKEDVVEISCHGGAVVLDKIMTILKSLGIREAKPGEFSYRAFLNGRVDLSQLQAVADIADAKSEKALFILSKQMKGNFSEKIDSVLLRIKNVAAVYEAKINFPEEEDVREEKKGAKELKSILDEVNKIINNSDVARTLKEGVRCVICGKANVGKSTLFNALLKEERVIVTDIAGTTRDVVEELVMVKGVPLRMYDTAGILEAKDLINEAAVKRSYEKLEQADLVLFVFDGSKSLSQRDTKLIKEIIKKEKNVIFVINKIDLDLKADMNMLEKYNKPIVKISALENKGFSGLEKTIVKNAYIKGSSNIKDAVVLANWQINLFKNISINLEDTLKYIKQGQPCDYIYASLLDTLENVMALSGENVSDNLLEEIFSNFCIGK